MATSRLSVIVFSVQFPFGYQFLSQEWSTRLSWESSSFTRGIHLPIPPGSMFQTRRLLKQIDYSCVLTAWSTHWKEERHWHIWWVREKNCSICRILYQYPLSFLAYYTLIPDSITVNSHFFHLLWTHIIYQTTHISVCISEILRPSISTPWSTILCPRTIFDFRDWWAEREALLSMPLPTRQTLPRDQICPLRRRGLLILRSCPNIPHWQQEPDCWFLFQGEDFLGEL